MPIELKVPSAGESITEVLISAWLKSEGDAVNVDDALAEIETEKATMDLPAPVSGTITRIVKQAGEQAKVGEVIAYMEADPGGAKTSKAAKPPAREAAKKTRESPPEKEKKPAPKQESNEVTAKEAGRVMPAARRILAEHGIAEHEVEPTGPGGRILKEDALRQVEAREHHREEGAEPLHAAEGDREEEIVPMSPLRRTIATRLVEAQRTAALLTTFNEIDMSSVMALRKKYGDSFQQKYGVKLGFMSFFVKAAIDALRQIPQLNAEIRESEIVYKNYYDMGIAIGGGKGLVVPILRNAERMSFAEIELAIADFSQRVQNNKIKLEELQGGTFTISNGGIYGSLLSTPIVNPPQSGILGLHAIQDRPVVRDGQIVIRPMMYVALTYDHRLVDGREAVTFLRKIKDNVEDLSRMLIEI